MTEVIVKFNKEIEGNIDREVVIDNFNNTINFSNNDVIPMLEMFLRETSDVDKITDTAVLSRAEEASGLKTKKSIDIIKYTKLILEDFDNESNNILKLIDKELPKIMTTKTRTVRQVMLIKLVYDFSVLVNYTPDLVNMIAIDAEYKRTDYSKNKVKTIVNLSGEYGRIVGTLYGKLKTILKDIPNVSDNVLYINEDNVSIFSKIVRKSGNVIDTSPINGFSGNPVYHFRLWLVDRDMDKLKSLKDKKRLIELRLTELREQDGGETDTKTKGGIEYYEEQVISTEYKINKLKNKG